MSAPRPHGLTTRAALLGLIACGLVVSAALPLREYLSERGQIADARARQVAAEARVASLEQQLTQWQDPAYVKAQARSRLHFVMPGEVAYVVLSPAPSPAPSGAAAVRTSPQVGPEAPWYSQLWGSVREADRPAPTPTSAQAPTHP